MTILSRSVLRGVAIVLCVAAPAWADDHDDERETLRLDGRVAGDVEAVGGELIIGPRAVVEGALKYRGPYATCGARNGYEAAHAHVTVA